MNVALISNLLTVDDVTVGVCIFLLACVHFSVGVCSFFFWRVFRFLLACVHFSVRI